MLSRQGGVQKHSSLLYDSVLKLTETLACLLCFLHWFLYGKGFWRKRNRSRRLAALHSVVPCKLQTSFVNLTWVFLWEAALTHARPSALLCGCWAADSKQKGGHSTWELVCNTGPGANCSYRCQPGELWGCLLALLHQLLPLCRGGFREAAICSSPALLPKTLPAADLV